MRAAKILGTAVGLGLLFAWMESLFLYYGLPVRLAARGYAGGNPVFLFLAVHCSAYLVMGLLSMSPFFGRYSHAVPFAGCLFMLSLPGLLFLSEFVSSPFAASLALAGVLLAAAGVAMLIGRWGVLLSTLVPDDVAVVYGLSPILSLLIIRFFSLPGVSTLAVGAPLLTLALLWGTGGVRAEETEQLAPLPGFPIWRLAVFLFCFHAANGFLISLVPIVFARTEPLTDWIRVFSSLGAALVFRLYPRSDLRNFYRGAFPFIAAALFFLTFSPYRTPARVFLEGGLSFLDLYAWLLLIYFASRTGLRRGAVINLGISIIVLAGTVSHFSILFRTGASLFPGQSNHMSFALLGIFLLLILLSLWDGREVTFTTGGGAPGKTCEEEGFAGGDDGGDGGDADPEVKEKEEEMGRRMKLMEFNLTRQETEIALLLLKGAKDLNICSLLYISQNTLKYHLRNIYRKTGSSNRRELKNILD